MKLLQIVSGFNGSSIMWRLIFLLSFDIYNIKSNVNNLMICISVTVGNNVLCLYGLAKTSLYEAETNQILTRDGIYELLKE